MKCDCIVTWKGGQVLKPHATRRSEFALCADADNAEPASNTGVFFGERTIRFRARVEFAPTVESS